MMNFDMFLKTLPIMGYGMGGIFIVIATVFLCIKLLCRLFEQK